MARWVVLFLLCAALLVFSGEAVLSPLEVDAAVAAAPAAATTAPAGATTAIPAAAGSIAGSVLYSGVAP